MAIGRISGQMLKANLERSGTDLAFETNLLALDVTNSRVGVGTASPATTFHVSATDAIRLPSGTTAQRPGSPSNGDIRYNSTTSQIEGFSNGQFRSMVGSGISNVVEDTTPQLGGDLDINGNAIVSTSDGNIAITPNGTGEVDISKVDIDSGAIDGTAIGANSASTGAFTTLSATGNVVLGDATGDSVTITGNSIVLSNTPTVTGTFADLGTVTTVDINGGSVDGAVIGANSAAAGTFTNLTASGTTISITDSNGSGTIDGVNIGSSTAGSGAFTTLETSGALTVGGSATITGNLTVQGTTTTVNSTTIDVQNSLRFEGATADAHETTLTTVDPTADRTISLPNASGTIIIKDSSNNISQSIATLTATSFTDGSATMTSGSITGLANVTGSGTANFTTDVQVNSVSVATRPFAIAQAVALG